MFERLMRAVKVKELLEMEATRRILIFGSRTSDLKLKVGMDHGLVVDSRSKSGGLMFLWNEGWVVQEIYGDLRAEHRWFTWEFLRRLRRITITPRVYGGESNKIVHSIGAGRLRMVMPVRRSGQAFWFESFCLEENEYDDVVQQALEKKVVGLERY
ncbi:hypothetical protein Adt_03911 [Abeliophyllum distichum]|uniref:Uncharacterized protein n=1 Tax=Abeliophyllum distichum TaxID=126358 RepID=A0ABD1W1W1_9LAMI